MTKDLGSVRCGGGVFSADINGASLLSMRLMSGMEEELTSGLDKDSTFKGVLAADPGNNNLCCSAAR